MSRRFRSVSALGFLLCLLSRAWPAAAADDVVLYSSDVTIVQGNWAKVSAADAAGGAQMASVDRGWASTDAPLPGPGDYFEATFSAPSATAYHVWLRVRASGNSKWNDSVWVQFNDSTTTTGAAVYRIGSSSGLLVNLEPCKDCGVSGWGWQDKGYWLAQSALVTFAATGSHTIRVQTREDGAQIDQIVLSPATYLSKAPGPIQNDATIVPKPSVTTSTPPPPPPAPSGSPAYSGTPVAIPGTVQAEDFDKNGDGVSYHDSTPGNSGGVYRSTDIDIEPTAGGGYDIGWTAAGEWMNYSVNVAAAGSYTVQVRVASPSGGGSLQVGFNGPASVWQPISIPTTGGWQNWTTASLPVTLGAGPQIMTLLVNSPGFNLDSITVSAASAPAPAPTPAPAPSGSGGTFRLMQWNVQSGKDINGKYDPWSQVQLMASQGADIICLDEVETWMADEPTLFKSYLEQVTGKTWYAVYAPNTPNAGTIGDLLLSRFPISQQNVTVLKADPGDPNDYLGNRGALRALIYIGGVPVNIIGTHLEYANSSYRTTQLSLLLPWAAGFGGPRVMAGDFNSWWGEYWPVTIMNTYSDTWQDITGSNQNGYTIGNVRYDYIFRAFDQNSHVTPTNVWVVNSTLSDHRPVVADFKVQ